jgi:hypothetical protein
MRRTLKYELTDETGLLPVEYSLWIEYEIAPAETDVGIFEPCLCDVRIVSVFGSVGVLLDPVGSAGLEFFRERLSSCKEFRDAIEEACFEHANEQALEAQESAADAKWQARRDGE